MKKIPFSKSISSQEIQDNICNKFNITLEKNYFNYIDTNHFLSITPEKLEEIKQLIPKIDAILLKTYGLYRKKQHKYLLTSQNGYASFLSDTLFPLKNFFVGRYDVLIDQNNTWKFIEFNGNTPGMITDVNYISNYLCPLDYENFSKTFQVEFHKKFQSFQTEKIGILLPYSFSDEDYLVGLEYVQLLSEIIPINNIVLGDIFESNIAGNNFFLKGEKIDIVINFFPIEFLHTDPYFEKQFLDIIKDNRLQIFNNLESIILQDKLLFALMWEFKDTFSTEEQYLIEKHIPFTTRHIPKNENNFLAKARFGRYSQNIFENNFDQIEQPNAFIYQEKVQSYLTTENTLFVLGIFTNLSIFLGMIAREQKEFITQDNTVKVIPIYTNSFDF